MRHCASAMQHRATSNPVPDRGADAQTERRSDVRRPCWVEAFCQPVTSRPDDLWWLATIQDASRTGLGLVSTRRYEPDAIVRIELRRPTGHFICTSSARVVHLRKRSEGGWQIGCLFLIQLSDHQLQALVGTAGADAAEPQLGFAA